MAVTATVALTDRNGFTIISRGSLADATYNAIWADKYNELGTTKVEGDLLRTPIVGPITVTVTTDYSTTGTWYVYIYYDKAGKLLSYPVAIALANASTATSDSLPIEGYLVGLGVYSAALTSPSLSPSKSPSVSPSASLSPSKSPSLSPSLSPSFSPSVSPSVSLSPSKSPSLSPSKSPSLSPSLSPSKSPSLSPSLSPSVSPSVSLSPSLSPSVSPSET